MPLEIEPITSAPSSADQTEPRPPNRLVPRDDRAGDRQQQQVAAARGLVDREQPRGGHDAADRRHRRAERRTRSTRMPRDADARAPRRLGVAADRVDVAAEAACAW